LLATFGQDWVTFGQVVGDASGALVGLLFVAVSLNRERIVKHTVLRASALQTMLVLVLPLLVAILLTTPRQGPMALGYEFIALGMLAGAADIVTGRWKRKNVTTFSSRYARMVSGVSPNMVTALLIVAAGACLTSGAIGGIYLVVPVVFLAIIGGVTNAWIFLMSNLE
jgi:modulator of FtsH protease